MGQNRLTLLFKYQIGLNIEFESELNRIIIDIPFLKTIIAFSKHAKGLEPLVIYSNFFKSDDKNGVSQ